MIKIKFLTRKFKVIACENTSSNTLYIFNEPAFNRESIFDEVRQKIWDCENFYNIYYQQYLTEKNWCICWEDEDKIVWSTTLELLKFSGLIKLSNMLLNLLDSEECFNSINNLVTHYY